MPAQDKSGKALKIGDLVDLRGVVVAIHERADGWYIEVVMATVPPGGNSTLPLCAGGQLVKATPGN